MQLGWLRIVIIGASVSIMLFAMSWLILKERGNPVDGPKMDPPVKGDPGKTNVEAKEPEKPREDPAVLEEKRAILKMRLTAVLDLKSEIGETLTTLEHEITAWETRIPPLMKSVDGKKIAANSTRAEQFAGVLEKDRVSKTQVKKMREKLDTLIAPIERAIQDAPPSYIPTSIIVDEIKTLRGEVRSELRGLRDMRVVMDTLLADSAFTEPGEKTLEKVIAEMSAEQSRLRAELIAKSKKEAYDAESKRFATAVAKTEQDLANSRLELWNARKEAEKQGIDLQTEDMKRKTNEAKAAEQKRIEKAKREAKFNAEYPAMKAYLLPFTSPGFMQFKGEFMVASETEGPVSFSGLLHNLKKDADKTAYFARQVSNYNNDRPVGAFPKYWTGAGASSDQLKVWYRVQDFLAEFGDIMVERKLLAP